MIVTIGRHIRPGRLGLFAPGAFGVYGYERGRKKRDQGRFRAAVSGAGAAALGTGTMAAAMTPGFLARRVGLEVGKRQIEAEMRARKFMTFATEAEKNAIAGRLGLLAQARQSAIKTFTRGTRFAKLGTAGALAGIAAYGAWQWKRKKR